MRNTLEVEFKQMLKDHVDRMRIEHAIFMHEMRRDFFFKLLPLFILAAITGSRWFENLLLGVMK